MGGKFPPKVGWAVPFPWVLLKLYLVQSRAPRKQARRVRGLLLNVDRRSSKMILRLGWRRLPTFEVWSPSRSPNQPSVVGVPGRAPIPHLHGESTGPRQQSFGCSRFRGPRFGYSLTGPLFQVRLSGACITGPNHAHRILL